MQVPRAGDAHRLPPLPPLPVVRVGGVLQVSPREASGGVPGVPAGVHEGGGLQRQAGGDAAADEAAGADPAAAGGNLPPRAAPAAEGGTHARVCVFVFLRAFVFVLVFAFAAYASIEVMHAHLDTMLCSSLTDDNTRPSQTDACSLVFLSVFFVPLFLLGVLFPTNHQTKGKGRSARAPVEYPKGKKGRVVNRASPKGLPRRRIDGPQDFEEQNRLHAPQPQRNATPLDTSIRIRTHLSPFSHVQLTNREQQNMTIMTL